MKKGNYAGAHNYALWQASGALGAITHQLQVCKSLTPTARAHLEAACMHLREAGKEIRARRVEPDGVVKEFPRDPT